MTRPFQVQMPSTLSMGDLIATQATILAALGWDLGMLYDTRMRPEYGRDWLDELRKRRWEETGHKLYKYKVTLVDPAFAITEPLKNPDSPLRSWLPASPAFYDLMETAWRIRNAAQHFDPPMTAALLQGRAKSMGQLAHLAGLPLASDCKKLLERLNHIAQGGSTPDDAVDSLKATLESEQAKAQTLALQMDALRKELAVVMRTPSGDELQAEVDRLQGELIAAEAEKVLAIESLLAAQSAVQLTNAAARRQAQDGICGLSPGGAWPGVPGPRILRLLPHVADLYDPVEEALLSDSVGTASISAALLWRHFLPSGGVVHLNEAGQASALVGARYVYLGSIDADGTDEG